jgi:hypothetical protein
MAASKALARHVLAAFSGLSTRSALNFLKNYAKGGDKLGVDTPGSLSTKIVYDTRTLAASASEDLDLAGAFANFTKVHAIYVFATSANTNNVVVGGASANSFVAPFTGTVTVGPGGENLVTSKAGWTVTAGTGDLLKIANSNSGSAVTYDIVVAGE